MIKITVGVLSRNEEKYIGELMDSLTHLSFPHDEFEIIVVDGNSSDKTREIISKILAKSDIKFNVFNEADFSHYGHCFARNLVLKKANKASKYVAYIDADCIADRDWLTNLYKRISKSDKNIAGVGGLRYIAKTKDKKEEIINSVLTSSIATGGNPAFSKRKIKFVKSIPNYNAIYKKEILIRIPYDDKLISSDDIELNYRLIKNGFHFLYEKNAVIYHHETSSIKQFVKNMYRYGLNVSNVIKKHKSFIRISVPFTLFLIFSPLLSLIWIMIFLNTSLHCLTYLPIFFYVLYIFLIFSIYLEVALKTKDFLNSCLVFILIPLQHIYYGCGVLKGLFSKQNPFIRKK